MDKPEPLDQKAVDKKQNQENRLALEAVVDMCQFGLDKFKELDKNKDGYLTKLELTEAAASGKYTGKELKQIKVMAENADQIQKAIHHGWKFHEDNYGIHKRDLSETQMWTRCKIEICESNRVVREVLNRNFAQIDTDGNKAISYEELRKASESGKLEREDRLNLRAAIERWYELSGRTSRFGPREIKLNTLDQIIKDQENRNGPKWHSNMIWSIADGLKK